jgi:gluconokinase
MHYVIGLDIGTTSAKAVLFDTQGSVLTETEETYPLYHPNPGWAEQDPYEIEAALLTGFQRLIQVSNVDHKKILTVGFSSAMHSIICMDREGTPISRSITWADSRGVTQALKMKSVANLYNNTGTPIHPMSPLIKLKWMDETNFIPYKTAKSFVSIKEYIIRKWFNLDVVDYSIASATGLFNLHTLTWDKEAIELAGISEEQLGIPVPPTYVLGPIKGEIAKQIGIEKRTPFVIGASDGPLANLGVGAINKGETAVTVGTSGAIRQFSSTPHTERNQSLFCYAFTKDLYIIGGPSNNGGIALQWLQKIIGEQYNYETLSQWADKVQPGAEGIIFHPYLNGERAPLWNADAKGSFFGLSVHHQKEHLARAVMEGVIYNLFDIGERIDYKDPIIKLLANGGFARSPAWLQILADVFKKEVSIPSSHQSAAWGAAWTALIGINHVKSFHDIKYAIPMKEEIQPNPDHIELYKKHFETYKKLRDVYQAFYN